MLEDENAWDDMYLARRICKALNGKIELHRLQDGAVLLKVAVKISSEAAPRNSWLASNMNSHHFELLAE